MKKIFCFLLFNFFVLGVNAQSDDYKRRYSFEYYEFYSTNFSFSAVLKVWDITIKEVDGEEYLCFSYSLEGENVEEINVSFVLEKEKYGGLVKTGVSLQPDGRMGKKRTSSFMSLMKSPGHTKFVVSMIVPGMKVHEFIEFRFVGKDFVPEKKSRNVTELKTPY